MERWSRDGRGGGVNDAGHSTCKEQALQEPIFTSTNYIPAVYNTQAHSCYHCSTKNSPFPRELSVVSQIPPP